MRKPKGRGRPIDSRRVAQWVGRFPGYRQEVTADRIRNWIAQFEVGDRDTAARVLDCVSYVSDEVVENAFRKTLGKLDGWNGNKTERKGKWRFVAFSKAAGESGDAMLHRWRAATGMGGKKYDGLYIHKSDLLKENLGPGDTVVFLDDFAGTGTQACDGWQGIMEELLPGEPRIYLILVAITQVAHRRISHETPMRVVSQIRLREGDNIFSASCRHFTPREKSTLLRYCSRANGRRPKGWGDCGLVIVLAHKTPNNSIPILHVKHAHWVGLFPRQ